MVERLRLRHRAREAVEHEAALDVGLIDAIGDDRHHHLIGNQLPGIHDAFGAQADRRAGGDRGAQHVAGGKLDDAVFLDQALRLRALPRSRRAEQDQSHRLRPRNFDRLIKPSYWCASR